MLEKGPLTALLGGIDLLSHPSLQENKKVLVLKKQINCLGLDFGIGIVNNLNIKGKSIVMVLICVWCGLFNGVLFLLRKWKQQKLIAINSYGNTLKM